MLLITCTTLCVSVMCLWKSIGGVSSTNQYVTTSLRRKARYESWQRLVVVHTLVIVCFNDTFNIAIGTSLFKTLLPRTSSSTEDIVTNPAMSPPPPPTSYPPPPLPDSAQLSLDSAGVWIIFNSLPGAVDLHCCCCHGSNDCAEHPNLQPLILVWCSLDLHSQFYA